LAFGGKKFEKTHQTHLHGVRSHKCSLAVIFSMHSPKGLFTFLAGDHPIKGTVCIKLPTCGLKTNLSLGDDQLAAGKKFKNVYLQVLGKDLPSAVSLKL
jgi:hypothetical protein